MNPLTYDAILAKSQAAHQLAVRQFMALGASQLSAEAVTFNLYQSLQILEELAQVDEKCRAWLRTGNCGEEEHE